MKLDVALAVSEVPERSRCAQWPVFPLPYRRKHTTAVVASSADTLTCSDEWLFTSLRVPTDTDVELAEVLSTAHST